MINKENILKKKNVKNSLGASCYASTITCFMFDEKFATAFNEEK